MPGTVTRYGDVGPEFGLTSESTGYVQEFNQKTSFDEALCQNHIGEDVAASYVNKKYDGTITYIVKNGATLPTVMTAATLANLSGISKAVLTEVDKKKELKGYTKYSYTYKAWDSITL
jgi:hypothetical protein